MNEAKSLEIIQEMIDRAKGNMIDNSIFYLIWGWLVLISSISHYVLLRLDFSMPWIPWVILMPLGGIAAWVVGAQQSKKKKNTGYMDRLMSYVWGGFVVTLIIVLLNGPRMGWDMAYGVLISLYGLATFISGGLLKFKPLIYGGISAWLIAIISFFMSMEYILLLMALSMITSYLIPGYLLRKSEHGA
jgi:hypothetical protein